MPLEPAPVSELLVSYSAEQMPVEAIVGLQRDTMLAYGRRERTAVETLKITNLLLTVALQKLTA